MKTESRLTLLTLLTLLAAAQTPGLAHADSSPLASANNSFGHALTRAVSRAELSKKPNENLFLSPQSAATLLQMILNGTGPGSVTQNELLRVLNVDHLDLDQINQQSRALMDQLQTPPNPNPAPLPGQEGGKPPVPFTLQLANSVWANSRTSFQFNPEFLQVMKASFSAPALAADFSSSAGLKAVNGWASDHTQGRITSIIDQPTLAASTLVLMNATYFKANWLHPFTPESTRQADFTRADGTRGTVEMMQALSYGYREVNQAQVMELPYAGGNASMYVVLPAANQKIADTLEDAAGPLSDSFWEAMRGQPEGEAQFSMPRFKTEFSLPLNPELKSMGLQAIFGPGADLSHLGQPAGSLSLVKQDTFLNVDEMGTEAAAVTIGAIAGAAPYPRPIPVMTVDRPFVISIVEKTTGAVLFEGVINNP